MQCIPAEYFSKKKNKKKTFELLCKLFNKFSDSPQKNRWSLEFC